MSYRILTKNSVDNTNIDGARQNHFNASMRSGVVEGALNECNVTSPASNQIVINTGELRISGHQIVITESEQMQLTTTPQTATDYSIIAEISVDSLSTPVFRMFIQPQNSGLIQDNLFATLNGVGTYQIKLANFTQNTDGTINNVVKTAELIGGTNDTQSQIDNINNTLDNKSNKDLSNVTYPQVVADGVARMGAGDRVIERWVAKDGKSWYEIYESGWKKCGGIHKMSADGIEETVALPDGFEFTNVNYFCRATALFATLTGDFERGAFGCHPITNKTISVSSSRVASTGDYAFTCYWTAEGC